MEDENSRELPSYIDLYRPIRQTIYSVLFNLNKLKIVHENTYKDKGQAVLCCKPSVLYFIDLLLPPLHLLVVVNS